MVPKVVWDVVAFCYGIAIGSFLNVVIWRLPRGGSVANPVWSFCPRCEHRLGALDLIPVLSFLALGARCRYCRNPISWRYPLIELLTSLLFLAVAWRFGGSWDTICFCLFAAILICVFIIDLEHFIIPDELNVLGVLLGLVHNGVALALGRPGQWVHWGRLAVPASLAGLFGYAFVIYAIGLLAYVWMAAILGKRKGIGQAVWEYSRDLAADWAWVTVYYLGALVPVLRRYAAPPEPPEETTAAEIEADDEGMGWGDGKLAAAIGANLGLALALGSFAFAIALGAAAGLVVMARQRRTLGQKTAIPFGPAMAAGALLALFFGHSVWTWYRSLWAL